MTFLISINKSNVISAQIQVFLTSPAQSLCTEPVGVGQDASTYECVIKIHCVVTSKGQATIFSGLGLTTLLILHTRTQSQESI